MKNEMQKFKLENYDPSKPSDAQLVDDWRLTCAKYSIMKDGGKTEFELVEDVEKFGIRLLAEILKRGKITFHPDKMEPTNLELLRFGMAEIVKGGFYLTSPHGELIYEGKKQVIGKSRKFEKLLGFNILVSGDKAYGFIRFKKSEKVNIEQFQKRESEHQISEADRLKWWPSKTNLYLYPVRDFIRYEEPELIKQITGAQVFIKKVEFMGKDEISKPEVTENYIRIPVAECDITATIDKDVVFKPYPQEHACRLRNPDDFKEGSFRRMEREHDGKRYAVIMGRLKGEITLTEQAYRYDKEKWTTGEGKAHCSEHDGTFEAAIEEEKTAEEWIKEHTEKQATYNCECIECGTMLESEEHCRDIKCPKCGGEMRRVERPGPGQKNVEEDIILKGAIRYKKTPLASEGIDWDAAREVALADVDDLKIMCAWVGDSPENKGNYKLPHHKASGGHACVWRAVASCAAILMGSRGGIDIPTGDVVGVKSHIASHYKDFDKGDPPWLRKDDQVSKSWQVPLIKSHEERFVYGIVLQPDIEDGQGDMVNKKEIAKAAHQFLENCQKIGVQHEYINPQIKIWESYVAPQDLEIDNQKIVEGAWILGVHILDDKVWQSVKKDELTGFSIKGWANARRTD